MKKPRKNTDSAGNGGTRGNGAAGAIAPGTTGRYLVLLREDALQEGIKAMSDTAGLRVFSTADVEDGAIKGGQLEDTEAIVFDKIGVAVVDTPPEQIRSLSMAAAPDGAILAIEPERIVYAIQEQRPSVAPTPSFYPFSSGARLPIPYLKGYRDAVNHVVDKVLGDNGLAEVAEIAAALDESEVTWGLQVTKVAASRYSGKGIRVAVLDTGLDLEHPDFAGRTIMANSFVADEAAQDAHSHGTHCIGTACGPQVPGTLPRYGIAYQAEIYAGKVLSNQGSGNDEGILAGINWAVTNACQVISMSLGAPAGFGQTFSLVYEQVARRALRAGTLIIAAAGNESDRRWGSIKPVGHPANCPAVMAVGALDPQLLVAWFSCGGLNPKGGQVDIAGPGVDVRSSVPRPGLYDTFNGTSMATPHVAGIAAMHAEADPDARGRALWSLLVQSARRLALPARDVGSGLVQAP